MSKKFFAAGDMIIDENGNSLYRLTEPADFNDKFYVVHALDVKTEQDCLLKFAGYNSGAGNINNLIREGGFRFCYPYIERVYGNFAGQTPDGDKIYGVAVEFIKGLNLKDYRQRLKSDIALKKIPEEDAEKIIFRQMLQFLYGMNYYTQHAGQSYLHRDLKPENIMITENKEPKIVDFDFAHISDSTKTISAIGWDLPFSAGYTSPSAKISGTNIRLPGLAEEIYSAGRLLFFWLNGRDYFTEGQVKMSKDAASGFSVPASSLYCQDDDIGYGIDFNRNRFEQKYLSPRYAGLVSILERMCLKPDDERIYHSVKEITQDFEDFLAEFYGSGAAAWTKLQLNEMPLLKDIPYEDRKSAVMLTIKVDEGPRRGKLLYEYTMRDVFVDGDKIMMIYYLDGDVYYVPVYGRDVKKSGGLDENAAHGRKYRIQDGDTFLYLGRKIQFTVG